MELSILTANNAIIKEEDEEETYEGEKTRDDSGNSSDRESQVSPPQIAQCEQVEKRKKDRVVINCGGQKHETYISTLKNIPDTRLSWLTEASANSADVDPNTGEYFFDRHPSVFSHILNYYRTGKLHSPLDVCGPLYEDELGFWGIDDQQVESCCFLTYRQHRDAQENLADFEGIDVEQDYDDEEPDIERYGFHLAEDMANDVSWYDRNQPRIWTLMEEPYSSKLAKVIAYISLTFIVLSVFLFCMESLTWFQNNPGPKISIFILESICVVWFTLELVLRFIFCPEKLLFFKKPMNWIDFLAIVPYYIQLPYFVAGDTTSASGLMVIRLIRIFRIFKLSRHFIGLQILGHTLKASIRELILLIFFLLIGVVIFASLIYYAEKSVPETKFTSIPQSFWWAVVTMTTVGYGDMTPKTVTGKLIGSMCAVCGVLMIALPVPVIVNNFSLYYSHAQARLKLPKKRRRVLVNAANALKSAPQVEEQMLSGHSQDSTSSDSGCERERNGRKCSLTVTDETAENRPRRPPRRDSHLFGVMSNQEINGGTPCRKGDQYDQVSLPYRRWSENDAGNNLVLNGQQLICVEFQSLKHRDKPSPKPQHGTG